MMAKSLSVQDYGAKDPLIPHSTAWGVLTLEVEDMSANKSGDNFYKPVYQEAIDANAPIVDRHQRTNWLCLQRQLPP